MATSKNDILDSVVKRVDEALASGQKLPWQKPWEPQYGAMSMPHNPTTGKMYSLGNTMILSIAALDHDHDDPRWMTYKQAKEAGWNVRKGEHAAAHIYAPITRLMADEKTGIEEHKLVGYRGVALFNAAQIDGIPPMAIVPESERLPKTIELDAIAQQMGVGIQHSGGMAFYRSSDDRIQLPPREAFIDQHGYDVTKAHELTHATGHPSRLNRDKQYQTVKGRAAEEMTAEIGAYLMSQRLGVPFLGSSPDQTDEQHAAYLTGWARDLTPEERRASIDNGIKAANYMEKQLELARVNGLVVEADRGQVVDHGIAGHSPTMESGMFPLPAGAAEGAITHPEKLPDAQILEQPENTASVSKTPAEWRAWKERELVSAMERLGGYPAVLADPEKSLELQGMLDNVLGERGVNIRKGLLHSGDWGPGGLGELVSDDAVLTTHPTRVGAGADANITQLHWHITMPELDPGGKPLIIDDLMDRSADDMAKHITEQAMLMQRDHGRRFGVLPQKKLADSVSLLPEKKAAPAEIKRGDHLVYRDGPGCIEDAFVSAVHGSQVTVIPIDRDKNGAISTWVMRPIAIQQDQIIKHTAAASMEAINRLSNGNQGMTNKAFGDVRRTAYKSLSKSAFVEMAAAQVVKDKPEIDKLNAERATQRAEANARNEAIEQKRLAGIRAEQGLRIAEKEARFAEAFDGGSHTLKDNKAYPLNPGDYVSYISPSGRGIDCVVRDKAALPADPTHHSEVVYQRIERGGLSGDGKYELGLAVAGDISKSRIMEHTRNFLPERSQIKKTNSPELDDALDKRMQKKREADSPGTTAKGRPVMRQKDLGLER